MDATAFAQVKSNIMRAFAPSGGDDLLGMEIDFNAYLYGLDALADAQARRTDNPARLIEATATAKRDAADEVVSTLEATWTEKLRYDYREGHVITRTKDSVRLSAITQIAPNGFYVTAEVIVTLRD